jgi:hypothetical protein
MNYTGRKAITFTLTEGINEEGLGVRCVNVCHVLIIRTLCECMPCVVFGDELYVD